MAIHVSPIAHETQGFRNAPTIVKAIPMKSLVLYFFYDESIRPDYTSFP